MSEAPADIFCPGEVLADTYEIRAVLGEGAMGQVFEAYDRALNRKVAIKAGWPGLEGAPVRKEAQAVAAVRHASMPIVHAVGVHRGIEFVVMERVYGLSLEAYLEKKRSLREPLSIDEVQDLVLAIAEGLAAVHRAGIAHRDVKPANVMLAPNNRVVLVDFGLFLPEFDVSSPETIDGSPQYMAPEVIANRVEAGLGHLTDLYALGVIAFELLTGELPFSGSTPQEVWERHLHDAPPDVLTLRRDVPEKLARLVNELLAKDPHARPQSVDAVIWLLRAPGPRADVLSVLVVDDDPEVTKVLTFYVKRAAPDAEVRVAADGTAALEAVRQKEPHLMLLDLQMPKMNGIEVAMYLRGARLAESCVIVSVSAGAQDSDREVLEQLGVTRFVPKGPRMGDRVGALVTELRAGRR